MADEETLPQAAFKIIVDGDDAIDLGAPADKIQITWIENEEENKCTLQDFFDNWINFKKNNTFVYYGEGNPTDQLPIKVWYDTAPND